MLSRFVIWSGYAAISGGVLFATAVVLHPLRDGISVLHSGPVYGAVHNVGVLGLMLQLLALVGLFVRQSSSTGQRGPGGFLVVFFGQLLYICLLVVDGLLNPALARFAPETVHAGAHIDPNFLAIVLPALILFPLGYVLFSRTSLSERGLPRLGSWLLTIGAPIYILGGISIFVIGPASPIVSVIEIAGAVPLGLGYVLLGRKLLEGMASPVGSVGYQP